MRDTRHNAGFMAVDTIAQKHHTEIKRIKFKGTVGECYPRRKESPASQARAPT